VIFLPLLAKNCLPWQYHYTFAIRNVFSGLADHENPVISNHILAISRRNAFIAISVPKIGCHGNTPLSLVYGIVKDEFFSDTTNPISKPNSAWICCIQVKLWPFLSFFGLFWPKFGFHGNVLRRLQCLLWIGRPRKLRYK